MELTAKQIDALLELQDALAKATECGLMDELAAEIHPDVINRFCDGVESIRPPQD